MEMDQFMEIIENSGEFEICEPEAYSDTIYKATSEPPTVIINGFSINPSKIGIRGKNINFWVDDALIGSFTDPTDLLTLEIK